MMRIRSSMVCCLVLSQALLACGSEQGSHAGRDAGADEDSGSGAHAHTARDGGGADATDADADLTPQADASDRDADPMSSPTHTMDAGETADASPLDDASVDSDGATPQEPPYRHPTFAVRTIAAGYAHACAITTHGALYCWGQNSFGQLGLDDTDDRATPARIGDEDDWSSVATGRYHTCAIRSGSLYCWGGNGFSQLAIAEVEEQHAPALIDQPGGHVWTAVTAGDWHTCALDDAGAVFCWGYDLLGRLGIGKGLGNADDPGEAIATPTAVDEGASYVAIDAGASHTCGVRDNGELWCWGLGDHGQLGAQAGDPCELNTAPVACSLSPLRVSGSEHWALVSAGGAHTCALTEDDALYCFGDNASGQLGSGGDDDATAPVAVYGRYAAASAGTSHACAVRADEHLVCFGNNESDQLGIDAAMVATPSEVISDATFSDVSAGALCTCAVGSYGAAFCWGTCAYSADPTPSVVVAM